MSTQKYISQGNLEFFLKELIKKFDRRYAKEGYSYSKSEVDTKINLLDNKFALIDHIHEVATGSTNGFMSMSDKKKLDGIQENANNYVHPSTHPATMIVQDSAHRMVTDSNISKWNSKAEGSHNHDDRYFTETEARSLFQPLGDYSLSSHIHANATSAKDGFMSKEDKNKLVGIEANANRYVHPSTHPATIIVQDTNHRMVTDANIASWNSKAEGNHNHDNKYLTITNFNSEKANFALTTHIHSEYMRTVDATNKFMQMQSKSLSANTDLNTITISGNYHIEGKAVNSPLNSKGTLYVNAKDVSGSVHYISQIFIELETSKPRMFFRSKINSTTWSSWIRIFDSTTGISWNEVNGKPSTMPPSNHQHDWGDIIGIPSATDMEEGLVRLNHQYRDMQEEYRRTAASSYALGEVYQLVTSKANRNHTHNYQTFENNDLGMLVTKAEKDKWNQAAGGSIVSGSAEKLKTPRTISLTGDVTGRFSFDGSKDVSFEATVLNDSHTHNTQYYTKGETDSKYALTSHSHDDRYYTKSQSNDTFVMRVPVRIKSGTDLNTITTTGNYVVEQGVLNAPHNYGRLTVFNWDSNKWATQVFYTDTTNEVYTRCATNKEATSWSPWKKLISITESDERYYRINMGTVIDFNLCEKSGIYRVANPIPFKNGPIDFGCSTYGNLEVMEFNSTFEVIQRYTDARGDIFTRFKNNSDGGTWLPWIKVFTSNNKPSWNDITNKPSTFAPSSHDHQYIGDSGITLIAHKFNEINFGGSFKDNTSIFFGYTQIGDKPIPTDYTFGRDRGTANVRAKEFFADGNRVYHTGNKPSWNDINGKPEEMTNGEIDTLVGKYF